MIDSLRTLEDLKVQRAVAMHRARWCKQRGMTCFTTDVAIARRFHRMLLRSLRSRT